MSQKIFRKIRTELHHWYTANCRDLPWRRTTCPYAIWVSEVMLQQTQVNTVIPYYKTFLKRFPDVETLANADTQAVLKVWEGLGYYARARNLHRAAGQVMTSYKGKVPNQWKAFRELSGVGDYIASAVLSIAFNDPHAAVDGNIKRVLARLFTISDPVNHSRCHKKFQSQADKLLDVSRPGLFNQAMMELGALICTPRNPACRQCPLNSVCKAHKSDCVPCYPQRIKKAPTPTYPVAVAVVQKNGQVLITRRKPEGLLGGLWEFPGGKIRPDETPEEACRREVAEETALSVVNLSCLTQIKHAYVHFKIEAEIFLCDYANGTVALNGPVDHRWIYPSEIKNYPFPKANHKFIPLLIQHLEKKKNDTHSI